MKIEHEESLIKLVCEIFEQLAFMFGEQLALEDIECDLDFFVKATMSFTGNTSGTIEIIVPYKVAEILAFNILGLDETEDELEPDSAEDALREALNTICGRLMPLLFGEQEIFDLSVPETSDINKTEWAKILNEKNHIAIDLDDYPVLLNFSI